MSKSNKRDYGEGFLYADDMIRDGKWIQVTLTIKSVVPADTITADNGKLVDKKTLTFEQTKKMFSLCKTNERMCKLNCGSSDDANWIGKKITFFPTLLASCFGEKNVPAVRVRLPKTIPTPSSCRKELGSDLTGKPINQQEASE